MASDTDPDLLLPRLAAPGPCLTLQQFCGEYSLSNVVYHKLNENGYTSSDSRKMMTPDKDASSLGMHALSGVAVLPECGPLIL